MSNVEIHTGKEDIKPEDAGYYSPQLEKLDNLFLGLINEEKLQCASYLLARKGKIFACKSMGRLLYDNTEKPFLPTSIRRIASITKLFTSIGIMQLIEKGKLYLEQPVADIIKEFQTEMHSEINLFHLLTHTSGLAPDPGFSLEPYPVFSWELHDVNAVIQSSLKGPVHFKPGERWAYCTSGYVILGEVIKRVSGLEYIEYVRERIRNPLGMNDSFFKAPEEKKDRICLVKEQEKMWHGSTGTDPFAAGGGMYSTIYDLFRVSQMMLNKGKLDGKRILGRKSVEKMTTNQLSDIPADAWGSKTSHMNYGLGWSLVTKSIITPSTYSREGAGRSAVYIDPDEELIAVYFVPTLIDWLPESVINPLGIIWAGLL
ncbi:MAG: serine hydrolase [Spirochaetales bacterium]|nr:serine hydrolase [Spirochaetales bacterium]